MDHKSGNCDVQFDPNSSIRLLKKNPFLTSLIDIVTWLWTGLINILNFELRLWWLLVGLASLILVLYLISLFQKEEPTSTTDFADYVEGRFINWKWTWNWKWHESKKAWVINDLTAHCPKCDTPLIEYSGNDSFECPRCNYFSTNYKSEKPYKIERIILDNINRKNKRT